MCSVIVEGQIHVVGFVICFVLVGLGCCFFLSRLNEVLENIH